MGDTYIVDEPDPHEWFLNSIRFIQRFRMGLTEAGRGNGGALDQYKRDALVDSAECDLGSACIRAARRGDQFFGEEVREGTARVMVAKEWPTMAFVSPEDDPYIGFHPCPPLPPGRAGMAMYNHWAKCRRGVTVMLCMGLLP